MSDHPKRTLPLAASITHLKREAKALRADFDAGDADGCDRVAVHVEPLPAKLTQAQALFVVAREYGFPSWPVLKRLVERRTRTVFADVEGAGPVLADLLGDANVSIADTLESALDSASEVLVLYLGASRSDRLPAGRVSALQNRKLVVTGDGADWLCRELDLEVGGGMSSTVKALTVFETTLLDREWRGRSIEPLVRPQLPGSYMLRTDFRHLLWRHIPDELRVGHGAGFVDVIAGLDEDASAVVARQANCIFAGVMAHPGDWSAAYRELFRRLVAGFAERHLDDFKPAIVPRDVLPPGTVRFDLGPAGLVEAANSRSFHFQFDRATVLTAVLRHNGSDSVQLGFHGGPKLHYATGAYAEGGETLTLAVAIRQKGISAMAGRYWTLDVANTDRAHGMSAELTVRYDTLESSTIRPLPSNASFEHFHWFAERSGSGDPEARRSATAQAFGFDDWRTLQDHVAWSEPRLPGDGARMRDIYLAQAQAKYGESFGVAELMEFLAADTKFTGDLRRAVVSAFSDAAAGTDHSVGVEHLLLALLDNTVADDVLTKCGADTARLRRDLRAGLVPVTGGPKACVSRELFGVFCRAGYYRVLGREGINSANVLVGMFAEPCLATELLGRQGIDRSDVIRYLACGIAKSLPLPHRSSGVLGATVEAILHTAFAQAQDNRHEAFGVDHLLLALMERPDVGEHLVSPAGRRGIRDELDAFVAATPTWSGGPPRPTCALNRVMQQAVARSRPKGNGKVDADSLVRAIANEDGTRAAAALARAETGG